MVTNSPQTKTEHSTETDSFCKWIQSLIDEATLAPGRAMVVGGDMVPEVELLVSSGFQVILVDPLGNDLALAKQRRIPLTWAAPVRFMDISPWQVGNVDLVLDRNLLETLTPGERFAYANRMGRFLASGSHLAGIFQLGAGGEEEPPYSLPKLDLDRMLSRYFQPEVLRETGGTGVTPTSRYLGLWQRRDRPRRAPRPR